MEISIKQFSRKRLATVWQDRFPRVILGIAVVLGSVLAVQTWYLFTVDRTIAGDMEVDVSMRVVEGKWAFEPDLVTVPAGAVVHMTIMNEDPFAHGFAINELGLDQRLPGGRTTEFSFVADVAPGEYEFFCSVFCGAGHFGQRGTLVVTEGEEGVDVGEREDQYADVPVRSRDDAIAELPYVEDGDGVKEFHLTVDEVMWDYGGDGEPVYSWGYNAQLPGPDIRVTEGDRVRVVVENNLPDATSVHWHGVDLEWEADGVPGVTQDPIAPGDTYVYEFTATPAGTRIYHTHGSHHGDEHVQMDMGLAGALIIDPPEFDAPDVDVTWVLTERINQGLFAIQGAVFPSVPPIEVSEGERVRVRMINAGSSTIHPMHLHGHQYRVVAVDGNPVPDAAQLTRNTQPVLPGETYDVEFIADNPGIWLFHCHELQHAAGGMIGEVHYRDFEPTVELQGGDHGAHGGH